MDFWREFHGPNAGYIVECYERYRDDPASIDADMRAFFDRLTADQIEALRVGEPAQAAVEETRDPQQVPYGLDVEKIAAVNNLSQSIRWYGHFAAQLDPLGTPPLDDPSLHLSTYNLTADDLPDSGECRRRDRG
jgi:2-oxoglutarate dehydrogenase E1 component